jgi:hypothetical protein
MLRKALILFTASILSNVAIGAKFCIVNVDKVENKPQGIVVSTSNAVTALNNDPLMVSYQDSKLGLYLSTLANAEDNQIVLKIYIEEEFEGDDAAGCRDGVIDYVGSIHHY